LNRTDGDLLFVHLSDIHFGAGGPLLEGPNEGARQRVLEDLADGQAALGSPDAILVTGDIAFSGKPHQYDVATSFLERAAETLQIEAPRVLVVPGNHDIDRAKVRYAVAMVRDDIKQQAVRGDVAGADEKLRDFMVDDETDPIFAPMAAYQGFASRYDCSVSGKKPYWDQTFRLGAHSSLLIRGLTTSLVSDANDFKANLMVGTGQTSIDRPPDAVAMILGHHPPDWWAEADISKPQMRGIVSLALFGHKHVSDTSLGDDCLTIVAGAVNPERRDGWIPEYNWLRLALEHEAEEHASLKVDLWPRRFSQPLNRFQNAGDAGGWNAEPHHVKLLRFRSVPLVEPRAGEVPVPVAKGDGEEKTAAFAADIHELPDEVVQHAVRRPMESEDGEVTPSRHLLYEFLALGYVQRQRVMVKFDLLREGDDGLPLHDLQVEVVERAREQNVLGALITEFAALADGSQDEQRR
jgi:hypothetical protein